MSDKVHIEVIIPRFFERALNAIKRRLLGKKISVIPRIPEGPRLHIGAGQNILEGYENLDGYDNRNRPSHFQTEVRKFIRAEIVDRYYEPESVEEIRSHHVFEHISILDVDMTLRGWNRIMKTGGLLWIEVPDFESCAKKIISLKREEDKEIYYRHIFGSQMGSGELHKNGFSAHRLIKLVEDYGFEVKYACRKWVMRPGNELSMCYPASFPLPDIVIQAIKAGPPKPEILNAKWTNIAYRKEFPNPELESK